MIIKGDSYMCVKTVYMDGNPKDIAYKKGKIYVSDVNGSLKDENGDTHYWDSVEELNEYFSEYMIPIKEDRVNHPSHYTWLKKLCGIEVIDITRHMNFNLGNVIKYVLRSGHKSEEGMSDKQKRIEDLKKAIFYLNDEVNRLEHDKEGI